MALASANGNDTVDKPLPPLVRAKVWRVRPLFRNRLAQNALVGLGLLEGKQTSFCLASPDVHRR
jgi:hypothetical protein